MVGVSYQEMLQSYGCVCPSGTTSQRRVDGVVLGTRGLWPLEGQDLYLALPSPDANLGQGIGPSESCFLHCQTTHNL